MLQNTFFVHTTTIAQTMTSSKIFRHFNFFFRILIKDRSKKYCGKFKVKWLKFKEFTMGVPKAPPPPPTSYILRKKPSLGRVKLVRLVVYFLLSLLPYIYSIYLYKTKTKLNSQIFDIYISQHKSNFCFKNKFDLIISINIFNDVIISIIIFNDVFF